MAELLRLIYIRLIYKLFLSIKQNKILTLSYLDNIFTSYYLKNFFVTQK